MKNLLVIIGSAKCGTTSLASWLNDHPSFCLGTEKEPKYFIDFNGKTWQGPAADGFMATKIDSDEDYLANFPDLTSDLWAADASTDYIWSDSALENIAAYSQSVRVRLVAIVRDPITRAISEYNHTLRRGWETLSFGNALDAEPERVRDGFHPLFYHIRRSTVAADLTRYRDRFGDDLLILDYADLSRDPDGVMRRICDFTDVPFHPIQDRERKNESKLPRNRAASFILKNQALHKVARPFVPGKLRNRAYKALHTSSRHLETVKPEEKDKLRAILKDEIDTCLATPFIPTENWIEALAGR